MLFATRFRRRLSHATPVPAHLSLTPCHPPALNSCARQSLVNARTLVQPLYVGLCVRILSNRPKRACTCRPRRMVKTVRALLHRRNSYISRLTQSSFCPIPFVDPNLQCVKRSKSVCRTETNTDHTYLPKNLGCTPSNWAQSKMGVNFRTPLVTTELKPVRVPDQRNCHRH